MYPKFNFEINVKLFVFFKKKLFYFGCARALGSLAVLAVLAGGCCCCLGGVAAAARVCAWGPNKIIPA